MRLICPNCDAQYEVPTNVIPAGGRDVQCSNCGHTWFQTPRAAQPAGAPSAEDSWGSPPERRAAPDPDPAPDPVPAPVPEPDPAPEPEPTPDAQPKPRNLDPSVLEVLREEAEREQRQRLAEAGSLESQPELGLNEPDDDGPARRARESRERLAQIKGDTTVAHSRRDLLPDIEEINQTLRATPERRPGGGHDMSTPQGRAALQEDMTAERDGFGKGFRLAVVAVGLAVLLYAIAPTLSTMLPALGTALDPYVGAIDGLRHWLDGQIVALLQMLDGMSSEAAAP